MMQKNFFKLCLPLLLFGTVTHANTCPKWFPMPALDGMVVVIPIYDPAITGPDLDCDELLDVVDPDIDGDGVANANDAFPLDASESLDTDADGIGNNADFDDDGDGVSDVDEATAGTDPLNASSKPLLRQSTTPSDDATNVDATANLTVSYTGSVGNLSKVAGKYFKVFTSNGTEHTSLNVSAVQVSASGSTITVNPNAHLVYGVEHYVHIDAGAFKDTANNPNMGIGDSSTWNFTVPSGSGPCGYDCLDNCDLPANLQQ